jgi:glucose-1-phosphatase
MPEHSIRLVCFDLGGVLVRICRSWEEGCQAAGLDLREGFRDESHEPRRRVAVDQLQTGDITPDDFWVVISECFNGLYTPDEIHRVHRAWMLGEYEGASSLVDSLNKAGHTTACLSNTNTVHWEDLLGYPALGALDHHHASHLMGLIKPDEEIYCQFERARDCRPDEILFFEDTAQNAAAANARGWHARVVDPQQETVPQMLAVLREYDLL